MATLKPKKTKIEETVVGTYQKIEDKFVEKFLDVEEEIIEIPEEGDEATIDAELDAKVKALIEESMDIIGSIPEPFAANATCEAASNAVVKVGTELVEALEEVYTAIFE